MDEPAVGDWVRIAMHGYRTKVVLVTGESRQGKCWVVKYGGEEFEVNKAHCSKARRAQGKLTPRKPKPVYFVEDLEYLKKIGEL